jgi:glucose/arabinose dehydrogenase
MRTVSCFCGATFTAETLEVCNEALANHQLAVDEIPIPVKEIPMTAQPEQPKPAPEPSKPPIAPPPALALVEALIMQLENALAMIQVPDYVESAAKNFVEALRKWAGA